VAKKKEEISASFCVIVVDVVVNFI